MAISKKKIHEQVLDAFRTGDRRLAWDLVCHNIGGKDGMTVPDKTLTADSVPTQWSWKHPSAVQAFALTYYGDEMAAKGGPDGGRLIGQLQESNNLERLASFSLTELRATLYFVQRASRWSDDDPNPKLVKRLLAEIRKRLRARDDVTSGAKRQIESITISKLRAAIRKLPSDREIINAGVWYRTQKEHWIGWLSHYAEPGAYGRKNFDRDAKFAYNHVVNPKMLLWLADAANVDRALLVQARQKAARLGTMMTQSGAIRHVIPWDVVASALWPMRRSGQH